MLDLETSNYDVGGHRHTNRALANLDLKTATRLHELLGDAIAAAHDARPCQPGIWSNETVSQVAGRRVA